jgi:hydroxymethylpyrimidine pyrophosphatase-like HAD family hydrolase
MAMMLTIIPCSSYIIPSSSSSSFHPPSSSTFFLWLNNNRRSSSFTKKTGRRRRLPFSLTSLLAATPPSQPPGGGKGKLYNDNELLEVLLLHQSITSTTNSTTNGNVAARVVDVTDDDDYYLNISKKKEEEPTPSATAAPFGGGIHNWILQALENDDIGGIKDDYYSNNDNNSDFDYTNDGSENNSIIVNDDAEEEASPLIMSTAIHDWILHAIENDSPSITSFDGIDAQPVDDEKEKEKEDEVLSSSMNATNNRLVVNNENDNNNHNNIQMLLQNKKPYIRAIATDVDGTLLYGTYMHPITRDAILKCISLAYNNNNNNGGGGNDGESSKRHFFVATGKSRAGAITSLGPEIGSLIRNIPGVYCQGLYCIDDQGNIIFERKLQHSAIVATEALAAQFGISIVAYDGDNLYTTNCTDSVIALSEVYGEPRVKLLLSNNESSACASSSSTTIPMYNLAEYKPGIHKILLLDDDLVKLGHVRTQLELLAMLHNATVTQAIPTMLELLPAGCSKAYGVEQVCLALGINPKTELLAIGDAENDVGMLNMASIGVAVGNASPQACNAADCIMKERVDEGGAGLAMNLFGFC